jgi:hypothetical protein
MLIRTLTLSAILVLLYSHHVFAFDQPTNQILLLQKQYLNQINQCAAPSNFSRLVDNALQSQNKEQKAQLAMTIEEMILQNPTCFVEASIKVGKSKCEMLEAMFIQEPHFNPREVLKESLSNTRLFSQSCFAS